MVVGWIGIMGLVCVVEMVWHVHAMFGGVLFLESVREMSMIRGHQLWIIIESDSHE
jgi:hypothetical protein